MKDLIKITQIESRAPNKNSIEWELPNEVTFAYMIIEKLEHTVAIKIKRKNKRWRQSKWESELIHATDAMTAIAKGVDFIEKYGYTIDNSKLSFNDKIKLGL